MKLNDSEECSDSNGLIFLQFSLFSVSHLLLHRVVRDAWRSLGLLGDFEHQVVDELLSGGVAGHGRLAHLRRTTSRSHLTVHQRHLGKGKKKKKKIKTCRDDATSRCRIFLATSADLSHFTICEFLHFTTTFCLFCSAAKHLPLHAGDLLFCGGPGCSSAALGEHTHHPETEESDD